jgi:hypothetical protein
MSTKQDYEYFINNIEELYKKYGHSFLVVKGEEIIGAYDTFESAFDETVKSLPLGSFLIQECVEDPQRIVHSFQGNVQIASQAIC